MKLFFDEEFTGLHKGTTLISIGIVAQNGMSFYAELSDYDHSQINEWLEENVIQNLLCNQPQVKMKIASRILYGSKNEIRQALIDWLGQFDTIEWISDCCHYDFVLLVDLLYKTALDIPNNMTPACYDINQDIARYKNISQREAFDLSREELLMELNPNADIPLSKEFKHNSMYDAYVIKEIYNGLIYI